MKIDPSELETVYRGLHAVTAAAFPKTCLNCGRTYADLRDFLRETEPLSSGSGLADHGRTDAAAIGLYRNCVCKSTLAVLCGNRRDCSPEGVRRRALFDRILDLLQHRGIERTAAHSELVAVMRGDRSERLEAIGIHFDRLLDQIAT